MADLMTDLMADPLADPITDLALDPPPEVRWEPCASFSGDESGTHVCGACGWLLDDHLHADATIRRLPVRAPSAAQPRRLAS